MTDLAAELATFAESGNQQRIRLNDGQLLQGWIMEIRDEDLLISTGFSEKQGKDVWVLFSDIDLATLEYWNTQQQEWVRFALPSG
jgi:hypothetical protein